MVCILPDSMRPVGFQLAMWSLCLVGIFISWEFLLVVVGCKTCFLNQLALV